MTSVYRERWMASVAMIALLSLFWSACGGGEPTAAVEPTAAADRNPPNLRVMSPAEGTMVQGIVTIQVQAEDDLELAK